MGSCSYKFIKQLVVPNYIFDIDKFFVAIYNFVYCWFMNQEQVSNNSVYILPSSIVSDISFLSDARCYMFSLHAMLYIENVDLKSNCS